MNQHVRKPGTLFSKENKTTVGMIIISQKNHISETKDEGKPRVIWVMGIPSSFKLKFITLAPHFWRIPTPSWWSYWNSSAQHAEITRTQDCRKQFLRTISSFQLPVRLHLNPGLKEYNNSLQILLLVVNHIKTKACNCWGDTDRTCQRYTITLNTYLKKPSFPFLRPYTCYKQSDGLLSFFPMFACLLALHFLLILRTNCLCRV